jgi:hypothetical protein
MAVMVNRIMPSIPPPPEEAAQDGLCETKIRPTNKTSSTTNPDKNHQKTTRSMAQG